MSDIFISYASEDRPRVRTLADALLAQGWSVWWDQQIPAGKTFDHVIAEALTSARCVVVVWSRQSINSNWVREEAEEGRKRGILIPVLIVNVLPPFGFGRIQAADLLHWDGTKTSEVFQTLAIDIAAILGPPPITTKTQGISTIERPPPQAVEEEKHQPWTAPKAILLPTFLYKRKLRWSLTVALFTVIMGWMLHWLGVFEPKGSVDNSEDRQLRSVQEKPVQAETQPRPTRALASESALKLIAILAEGSEPLTGDLSYEVYETTKDLEGKRKRVSYSFDAAPLFKLPAGRYYVTVKHGSAYASTEVEVTTAQVTTQTLNLQAGYLRLSSILAQDTELLTGDLSYEVYETTKDLEGKRKRVSYSFDAAPLFKLPAGRYYVTVKHGSAYASTEVEVTTAQVTTQTLNLQAGYLRLSSILAQDTEPLTGDLSYEVYETTKDLEGKRKRVSYSFDAAPLFKLPAGRYYVTVKHGSAYASTEVEVAAGQVHEIKLEIKMP